MARDTSRRSRHDAGTPVRITTAPSSRAEDIASRQRRYVISMTIRSVCFIAAVLVGPGWLRWVLVAGAVLLPYIAVVIANAAETRNDGLALPGGRFDPHELDAPNPQDNHSTDPPEQP